MPIEFIENKQKKIEKEFVIGDSSSSDEEEVKTDFKEDNSNNITKIITDIIGDNETEDEKKEQVEEEKTKISRRESIKDKLIRRLSTIPNFEKDDRSMAMKKLLINEIMYMQDDQVEQNNDRFSSTISQLEETVSRRDTYERSKNGDYIEELGISKKTNFSSFSVLPEKTSFLYKTEVYK